MLRPNHHVIDKVVPTPPINTKSVDLLAINLKIALALNFYHFLQSEFAAYPMFMRASIEIAQSLSHWLMLSEAAQERELEKAKSLYTKLVKVWSVHSALLILAAQKGYRDLVNDLIEQGSSVRAQDREGKTALYCAATLGHDEVVRILLRKGAAFDFQNEALYSNVEVVKVLWEEGALQAKDLSFVLWVAARRHDADILNLLIQYGVRLNKRNPQGMPALMIAAQYGHREVVQILIRSGAKLCMLDRQGRTPLHWAVIHNHLEVVEDLIEARRILGRSSHEITRALMIAIDCNHSRLVPVLIQAGANPHAEGELGVTPMICAIRNKHPGIVKFLLEGNCDPNVGDCYGFTPLMEAAWLGDNQLIYELIRAGAQVNACNHYGSTALMWAVEKGDEDSVQVLLREGAACLLHNHEGQTALDCARVHDQPHLIPLLKRAMTQQFYEELLSCSTEKVDWIILEHQRAGISKEEIYQYMLRETQDTERRIVIFSHATSVDCRGRPNTPLSRFMHHSQGGRVRTFFSNEESHAITRIKAKLHQLQAEKSKSTVDTSPNFG